MRSAERATGKGAVVLARSAASGKKAGADAGRAGIALAHAIDGLVSRAIDEALLGDKHVTSAEEARRVLAGGEQAESVADDIQRVVVLAVPVVRAFARGARLVTTQSDIVASSSISV